MNLSDKAGVISGREQKIAWDPRAWLSQIPVWLRRLGAGWAARRRRSRELGELYRLGDRELWDLGLSRSDLPSIENGSYRRD